MKGKDKDKEMLGEKWAQHFGIDQEVFSKTFKDIYKKVLQEISKVCFSFV